MTAETAEPPVCRVVDSSEHGMCLAWEDGGAGDARVGELLGVVDEGKLLQLATVRSIRVYREGGMELGLQLITGNSAPVYCRPADDEGRAVRALFMPASETEQVAATIIAVKGFYQAGRRLLIDVGGNEVQARAGSNVSDGPVFDRFEFSADSGD